MCVISVSELEKSVSETYTRIQSHLRDCSKWFVSFDVDVLDPKLVPGTGTPVREGLSFQQVLALSKLLIQDARVCGWEITELNPLLDHKGETVKLMADYFLKLTQHYEQHSGV